MEKSQLLIIGGIMLTLVVIIGGAMLLNDAKFGGDPAKQLTHGRPIHWHAEITAEVCGVQQNMPRASTGGQLGYGPIHTHDDALAHMEGVFNSNSDIAVRQYLASVGVSYSDKGIFNKTDGSPCPGSQTASSSATTSAQTHGLHGTVDGKPVTDILDYPMHNPTTQSDDTIEKIHLIYD